MKRDDLFGVFFVAKIKSDSDQATKAAITRLKKDIKRLNLYCINTKYEFEIKTATGKHKSLFVNYLRSVK